MKRAGIVLAAFAALLVAAHGGAANAQANQVNKKSREQGMAEAPAAITASKLKCTPTDAYLINQAEDKASGKKQSLYEVACQEGIGYIIQSDGDQAGAFNCLGMAEEAKKSKEGGLTCKLPGNKDPKAGVATLAASTGRPCTLKDARNMGNGPGFSRFEVACQEGAGLIVQNASASTPASANDCIEVLGTEAACQLTPEASIVEGLKKTLAAGSVDCGLSNQRYIGSNVEGSWLEIACGQGKGYMLQLATNGSVKTTVECTKAESLHGGCTLTNVAQAQQEEAATYTQLAKAAGFNCDVTGYRYIGTQNTTPKTEVVELACANIKQGGVGLFPVGGSKGQVLDCVIAGSVPGAACKLNDPSLTFAKYTDGLKSLNRTTCQVSNAKWLATTSDTGVDYIETACADGGPGLVLTVARATGKAQEALSCGQARAAGAPCTFPTNTRAAQAAGAAAKP